MGPRSVPRGLTYYDSHMGALVTEGPDVCDYKSRLKELDANLNCYFDPVQEEWIVTWFNEKKNQEEYILARSDLALAYQAVERARNDRPGAETAEQLSNRLEREQAESEREEDRAFRDIAGDAAERLMHAFKKDGLHDHEDIYGPRPKPRMSRAAAAKRTFR